MFPRTILACVLLVALSSPASHAAGVNLRWNACFGDGGVANKNFACSANTGTRDLVPSFALPAPLLGVDHVQVNFVLSAAGVSVPAWWSFRNPGTCRRFSFNGGNFISPAAIVCVDWAQDQSIFTIPSYIDGTLGPSTASFIGFGALSGATAVDLVAGQEYFAGNIIITSQNTVGPGACGGCDTPVCVAIQSISVDVGAVTAITLTQAANGTDSNFVTWQGGVGAPALPGGACPGATATRSSTWGLVKSLYR